MPLAHLLLATSLIKCHNMYKCIGLEIGGWVIECQMPVLANAKHASNRLIFPQQCGITLGFCLCIFGITRNAMKCVRAHNVN